MDWREPKVLVIYELDEEGRKKKDGYQRYDATLENCDAIFALMAGHLRAIGAEKAKQRAFASDGALWIWERVQKLCEDVGYDYSKVVEVVDFYHAKQRVHAFAAEVKSWTQGQREKWVNIATKLWFFRSSQDRGRSRKRGLTEGRTTFYLPKTRTG